MLPGKCPYLNRCDKYTGLTLKIDRLTEANDAKDRKIRQLEAEAGGTSRTTRSTRRSTCRSRWNAPAQASP